MHQKYDLKIKHNTRSLRSNMTKQEIVLWQHLRGKQINGIKFQRQTPLLGYILDFYAHSIKLGIELDGSQHFDDYAEENDKKRDTNLAKHGIKILRYSNSDIDFNLKDVLNDIYHHTYDRTVH